MPQSKSDLGRLIVVRRQGDTAINGLKRLLKVVGIVGLALLIPLVLFIFVASEGIPFVEGDKRVVSGKAYEFEIGMSKNDVLEVIRDSYNKEEYYVRILWLKDSEINKELEEFENTKWSEYQHRKYSEYKVLVSDLTELNKPLLYGERWDIKMPSDWVNSIYLTFSEDNLVEIMRSRWLFERP